MQKNKEPLINFNLVAQNNCTIINLNADIHHSDKYLFPTKYVVKMIVMKSDEDEAKFHLGWVNDSSVNNDGARIDVKPLSEIEEKTGIDIKSYLTHGYKHEDYPDNLIANLSKSEALYFAEFSQAWANSMSLDDDKPNDDIDKQMSACIKAISTNLKLAMASTDIEKENHPDVTSTFENN